jgi:excisionase family DNA binding protein
MAPLEAPASAARPASARDAHELVRPSELARFWRLHPQTVHTWIRQGRMLAIRSPGNHFRLRIADVRAFCEREGRPVPPFIAAPARRVIVGAGSQALRRAVGRSLRGGVDVETFDDPYEALVAAAAGATALVALPGSDRRFDAVSAVRALRRAPGAPQILAIAVFDVAGRAASAALEAAGADRCVPRGVPVDDVPRALRELLGLPPQ